MDYRSLQTSPSSARCAGVCQRCAILLVRRQSNETPNLDQFIHFFCAKLARSPISKKICLEFRYTGNILSDLKCKLREKRQRHGLNRWKLISMNLLKKRIIMCCHWTTLNHDYMETFSTRKMVNAQAIAGQYVLVDDGALYREFTGC